MKPTSPQHLLAFTGILYFVLSFFFLKQTFDIHLLDTYFIIALAKLLRTLACLLLVFWIIYKVLCKFFLSGFLSWTHIISTLMTSILIITFNFWSEQIYSTHGSANVNNLKMFERYNTILSMLTTVLVAGQLIFFINIIGGVVKKINKP